MPEELQGYPPAGMSADEVACFWTRPPTVYRTALANGHTSEQWVYRGHWLGSLAGRRQNVYLSFEDGALRAIQD